MSIASFARRVLGGRGGAGDEPPAERAARWLRDRLEGEARARFGWLDAGIWARGAFADIGHAARRLTAASVLGDDAL